MTKIVRGGALFEDLGETLEPVAGAKMGRPKGALNKKTLGLPKYLEALGYADPAVEQAKIYSMEHEKLAKMMRSKSGAAAVMAKLKACADAMPFLHGKVPVTVQVTGELPKILVIDGSVNQISTIEQNQALIGQVMDEVARNTVSQSSQAYDNTEESDDETAD